jgi:hypothetical protein
MAFEEQQMNSSELTDIARRSVSRRAFARKTIVAGLAAAGVAAAGKLSVPLGAQAAVTDIDILQFALNLEYLEAEFYTVATTGKTLVQSGMTVSGRGTAGDTTGGAKVALSGSVAVAADQITIDEQMHVTFLQTALSGASIAKPAINLEALGIGFRNQNEFLTLARAFEDVGVSAYGGAAPLINSRQILGAAVRIGLTEAQHAGVLRLLVSQTAGLTVTQVDNKDVPPLGSPNGRLFQVTDPGLSTVRNTSEVLSILYGGGTTRGGFFPAGVNGTITKV